jgi:hypothetical protein
MRKRYGATRFDDDAGQGAAMFGPVLRFFESGKDREGLHAEALGGSAALECTDAGIRCVGLLHPRERFAHDCLRNRLRPCLGRSE